MWNAQRPDGRREHHRGVHERRDGALQRGDASGSCPTSGCWCGRSADGWEPLCEFLELPVPDAPFPHVNDSKQFGERIVDGALLAIQRYRAQDPDRRRSLRRPDACSAGVGRRGIDQSAIVCAGGAPAAEAVERDHRRRSRQRCRARSRSRTRARDRAHRPQIGRSGRPVRTCQEAISVAPFQLVYRVREPRCAASPDRQRGAGRRRGEPRKAKAPVGQLPVAPA